MTQTTCNFSDEEIKAALDKIYTMDHETMCRIWRFGIAGKEDEIYFRADLPTSHAFRVRLFNDFGGVTPEMSRRIGWGETILNVVP